MQRGELARKDFKPGRGRSLHGVTLFCFEGHVDADMAVRCSDWSDPRKNLDASKGNVEIGRAVRIGQPEDCSQLRAQGILEHCCLLLALVF